MLDENSAFDSKGSFASDHPPLRLEVSEIPQPYQGVAIDVCEALRSEFGADLLGVALSGSVAYGTPHRHSDLDIRALTTLPWSQRRTFWVRGVHVDLGIDPADEIYRSLKDRQVAPTVIIFRGCRVLFDRVGHLSAIRQKAQESDLRGRPFLTDAESVLFRHVLKGNLLSILSIIDSDPASAHFAIFGTLWAAIDVELRLRRVWATSKPTHQVGTIAHYAPELTSHVTMITNATVPIPQKFAHLCKLVYSVLAKLDGHYGATWAGEKHPVQWMIRCRAESGAATSMAERSNPKSTRQGIIIRETSDLDMFYATLNLR